MGTEASTANPLRPAAWHPPNQIKKREVTMTAKHTLSLSQPTSSGRICMLAAATVAALAIGAALGAATTLAQGTVYVDNDFNAAAGQTNFLFNATFTGTDNIGLGRTVMTNLTDGTGNVATGSGALSADTTGSNNVATGMLALTSNTTGGANVAAGRSALQTNTTGDFNPATRHGAL